MPDTVPIELPEDLSHPPGRWKDHVALIGTGVVALFALGAFVVGVVVS